MKPEDYDKVKDFVYIFDPFSFNILKLKVEGIKYSPNPELTSAIIEEGTSESHVELSFCDLTLEDCYKRAGFQLKREIGNFLSMYVNNVSDIKTKIECLNECVKMIQDEIIKTCSECPHIHEKITQSSEHPDDTIKECLDCGWTREC